MTEDERDAEYSKRRKAIDTRVDAAIEAAAKGECLLVYSAYDMGDDDLPVDNLDQVVHEGKCVLVSSSFDASFWGNGSVYSSEVLTNPTWLTAAVHANTAIHETGDHHHAFFESLRKIEEVDGVTYFEMGMGS